MIKSAVPSFSRSTTTWSRRKLYKRLLLSSSWCSKFHSSSSRGLLVGEELSSSSSPGLLIKPESEGSEEDDGSAAVHPYKSLFPWKSNDEFVDDLLEHIVHNDDGLVAINKPFGVGVIDAKAKKKGMPFHGSHLRALATTDYSLQGALPLLRKKLDKKNLVLLKSTERMTSGIAVFAEDAKLEDHFRKMLMQSKNLSHQTPLYNYSVIAAGTPYTKERRFRERVGLHIVPTPLLDYMQPKIERHFSKNSVKRGEMKVVHVETNVERYGNHKTTLLQVQTSSIKWNFLRIYCADLLLPVLGDHLYSCRVRTILGVPAKIDLANAPPGSMDQILPPDLLENLDVKESIDVPPHMHLNSYTLVNYRGKNEHLILTAPLPPYFEWTLKRLRLMF